jgi:hypothetical protein
MPVRSAAHPDLLNPYLPDMADLDPPITTRVLVQEGGMSVRNADVEWPESGPSSQPMQTGQQPKVGPFGAKVIAAMTGATVTSLLSKLPRIRCIECPLISSDPV